MKEVVAGIDIGGTNTSVGLVEKSGKIVAVQKLITTDYPVIGDFVSELAVTIHGLIKPLAILK